MNLNLEQYFHRMFHIDIKIYVISSVLTMSLESIYPQFVWFAFVERVEERMLFEAKKKVGERQSF